MESNKTILYYTSNREDPVFEGKIRETLIENSGGLPIVSVSQKPLDFGHNICVGDVGHSYLNEFRQILIGARAAKTEYLVFAEADFIYPKEYFSFDPPGGDLYRHDTIWIVFKRISRHYCRKKYSSGAQIAKRDFVIRELEIYLKDQPEWADGDFRILHPNGRPVEDWNDAKFEYFTTEAPCVSFKTENGVKKSAVTMRGPDDKKNDLPVWGNIDELKRKYLIN